MSFNKVESNRAKARQGIRGSKNEGRQEKQRAMVIELDESSSAWVWEVYQVYNNLGEHTRGRGLVMKIRPN